MKGFGIVGFLLAVLTNCFFRPGHLFAEAASSTSAGEFRVGGFMIVLHSFELIRNGQRHG